MSAGLFTDDSIILYSVGVFPANWSETPIPYTTEVAHNVFEVTELCRTRADILKPTLDRTLVLRRTLKYKQNPQCRSFGVDMWAEKELIFI